MPQRRSAACQQLDHGGRRVLRQLRLLRLPGRMGRRRLLSCVSRCVNIMVRVMAVVAGNLCQAGALHVVGAETLLRASVVARPRLRCTKVKVCAQPTSALAINVGSTWPHSAYHYGGLYVLC